MKIEKPIFIIGTGRCGSTIFHNIFAHHPHVAWLSAFCEKYPQKPYLNKWFMKAIDIPVVNNYLIKKIPPGEAYDFWELSCKGFSQPCRDLNKHDVTQTSKNQIIENLQNMLTKKRNRLLIKITGWSRLGFLNEIFEDPIFIHVLRDGRGVVNSLLNVDFWRGWEGPQHWRWGMLNADYQKDWERYNESFVILAAIEWKLILDSIEIGKKELSSNQFLEIKYEDFMDEPIRIFKEAIQFCDLEWTSNFQSKIKQFELKNMNYKWKENLSKYQQQILNEYLSDYLEKYHYKLE